MGRSDHLIWLLRNLYAGQEAAVRTRHGTTGWFQIGKGVHQSCILSLCLFNLYVEYIMWNASLDESQAGIKISGRCINNLLHRWPQPYGRKQKRTKEPLDESEKGEWKLGLRLNIQKTKIMASSSITSWQIDGEKMETGADFIFLSSKTTGDDDYSHEIKKACSLEEKLWQT